MSSELTVVRSHLTFLKYPALSAIACMPLYLFEF